MECYYSRNTPEQTQQYLQLAEAFHLLVTCGSDFHGEAVKPEIQLGTAGDTKEALRYEVEDMERAVSGEADNMYLHYTKDVMALMTKIRQDWGMYYPEEL